jgi:glutamate synthase domain-containing protein 1
VCADYRIAGRSGYQAIGHTRMATESAVTIAHSHPFSTGPNLALVHNGSFSNYNSIRRDLVDVGVRFDTDNDTEVAARYVAYRMSLGDDLGESIKRLLKTLDGFFTLVVATGGSMAVVRDSFACKPLVVAETDSYVAVASEYIALTSLPGIEQADIFEPDPEEIYIWTS